MKRNFTPNTEGISVARIDGKDVPVLVSDLNAGTNHVIVSESVLDYLCGLLPKGSFRDIKEAFIANVTATKNMQEFAETLHNELEFHNSVNLIRQYYGRENELINEEPQIVG